MTSMAADLLRKGYEKAKAFVGLSDPYKILREAVFSPNPMRYRPIWSCDFRYNFTRPTIKSQGKSAPGSPSLLPTNHPHGGTTLGSCRMELAR